MDGNNSIQNQNEDISQKIQNSLNPWKSLNYIKSTTKQFTTKTCFYKKKQKHKNTEIRGKF